MTASTTAPAPSIEETIAALTQRITVLEGESAVRRLQHQYGYYLDKCLYSEVVDLFSRDCEVIFAGGIYRGRASAERLYLNRFRERFTAGHNGPVRGFLLDHPQIQDVVTVAPDGQSAQGRFRCLMQAGVHADVRDEFPGKVTLDQWWEGALYENQYVVEDGVWKIKRLDYRPFWHSEYSKGWSNTESLTSVVASTTYPEDPVGPDEIRSGGHKMFPETDVVPFHYPHPVTGEQWQ